jgi:uncharacterized protein (TIGR00369 family)
MDEAIARCAFEDALKNYEQDFGKFFLARLYGCEFEYTDEACKVSLDLKDFMFNPQGTLHGGVTAFVMDVSMGHHLFRQNGAGTTLEMKIQYIKAARAGRVTATGRFLRKGRSISYLRSELTDDKGDLLAFATSTWMALKPKT